MSSGNNIPLSRFNTAAALQSAATYYEVNGRQPIHEIIIPLLRKDAEDLIKLGLQELAIKHAPPSPR